MSTAYVSWPPQQLPIYTSASVLPSGVPNGSQAVTSDTDSLYMYNGTSWVLLASGTIAALSIGAINGQTKSANALVISGTSLYAQTADASFPGMVSTGTQTLAGDKTLTGTTTLSTLTASQLVATNGSKNLVSQSTGNLTDAGTDGITITGGTGAVVGAGTSISQHAADAAHNGYLTSGDWSVFNGKQATIAIGALDAQTANATGLSLVSNVLSAQSADATHPGLVNTGTQTFSGNKTFSGTLTLSSLIDSTALVLDGSKNVSSLSYTASANASTLMSRDSSGNTGILGLHGSTSPIVIDVDTGHLVDRSGHLSVDWINRTLNDTTNATKLTWDTNGVNVSNLSASQIVATNGSGYFTSFPYAIGATASTVAVRDSEGNIIFNNSISNVDTTTSSGGSTPLGSSSALEQRLTGSANQTYVLPNATTLRVGWNYELNNNSTGTLTITDFTNVTLKVLPAGAWIRMILTDISTSAGVWDFHGFMPANAAWGTAGVSVTGTITQSSLTANRALYADASKVISASATTDTELGYVNGVTSSIQTQLDSKQASGNYITALTGDVTASGPGNVAATLAATSNSTLATLSKSSGVSVHGTNTNDNAGSGYIGEYVGANQAFQTITSSDVYEDQCSITLSAGDWDITGSVWILLNGATLSTAGWVTLIGIVAGNDGTGAIDGETKFSIAAPTTATGTGISYTTRVSVSSSTTYYLKARGSFTIGNPQVASHIAARRAR